MTDELKQWEQDKGYQQGKAYMLQKIEDIKAEIQEKRDNYNRQCGENNVSRGLDYAIEIIDKHIESEGDNAGSN